jgi:hypothetical protein
MIYIRTLVYSETLVGTLFNYFPEGKIMSVPVMNDSIFDEFEKLGQSLLIGSIFWRITVKDSHGSVGLFPPDDKKDSWRDRPMRHLRALLKKESTLDFKIIGNREELEFLKKYSPPLYDRLLPHIIWKGNKSKRVEK